MMIDPSLYSEEFTAKLFFGANLNKIFHEKLQIKNLSLDLSAYLIAS